MPKKNKSNAVKIVRILTRGGDAKMVIFLSIVGIIIIIIVAIWLINILNTVLPILIGLAFIIGLGWLIYKVSTSNPQQRQTPQQNSNAVATCQSMYMDPDDISDCIKNGGQV